MHEIDESRRSALRRIGLTAVRGLATWALAGGALSTLVSPALAAADDSIPLRLSNPHTDEHYDIQLFVDGQWNSNALIACDYVMRDWRQNSAVVCDRTLYAGLYVMQRYFAPTQRLQINSGYRTKATNQLLQRRGYGAADNSMHLKAKAVDFVIPGVDLVALTKAVQTLQIGGTGRYDTFVHMDSRGQIVNWRG